jgi:hypothetical protein
MVALSPRRALLSLNGDVRWQQVTAAGTLVGYRL